jgi:heat-inducible transcriptional repressor
MPAEPNIGNREREILTAIVETFISTGEPVGSRTLARSNREGLSPASIRNVMADLSDAGFLEQPHASAGRVPTPEAYRYYVEQISGKARLAPQEEAMISDSLAGITDVQEFMERTSHVLSLISRNVGVAVATSGPKNALEHVYFSRLGDQKVLAVVVTRSGLVRDRVLRMDLPQADLDLAARYINENFRGWTMESLRSELFRRIEQERSEYDRLMNSIEQLYKQGALAADQGSQMVFVEGAANLLAAEQDRQRLQEMLKTLEEKEKVIKLLSAYLDVKQEAVRVVIGLDQELPSMQNFVLIGAPAHAGNEVMGSLAVIGPTRMDYQHTITSLS